MKTVPAKPDPCWILPNDINAQQSLVGKKSLLSIDPLTVLSPRSFNLLSEQSCLSCVVCNYRMRSCASCLFPIDRITGTLKVFSGSPAGTAATLPVGVLSDRFLS